MSNRARLALVVASVLVVVLVVALGLGVWLLRHRTDNGVVLPSGRIPDKPGQLVSAEPYTVGVPPGVQAWHFVYTTTRDGGKPALSSGLIMERTDPPSGPRPVVAWAHGTTGITSQCAPTSGADPATFNAIPGLANAVAAGWAIVATDYIGLGTPGPSPYLIGQGEGRSVLDSVRAARQFKAVQLQAQTVIWGHSQGGGAALWAGILAPSYAPDVNVAGVAAIAPAADLPALVRTVGTLKGGALFASYVIASYAANYPDVHFNTYVRPAAQVAMQRVAQSCIYDRQALVSLAQTYDFNQGFYGQDPLTGPLGARLRQNIPAGRITAPVLIAQGAIDPLVLARVQAAYIAKRCAQHGDGPLAYKTYPDREHVNIVAADSPLIPDLFAWTRARFEGTPAPSTC